MISLLAFIFSPSGHVGRGAWWITQINCFLLTVVLCLVLGESLVTIGSHIKQYAYEERTVRGIEPRKATPQEKAWEWARIKADLWEQRVKLTTVGVGFLVLFWWSFVIEVKRWHDLGMSGLWVLLRFVPAVAVFFVHEHVRWVQFIVFLIQIIFLGLCSGIYMDTAPGKNGKGEEHAPGFGISLAILGVIVVTVAGTLMAMSSGVAWATKLMPMMSRVLFGQSESTAPVALDESAYHGTKETQFAKDWVMLDGEKVAGISSVLPAAGGKVCLVYSGGGKSTAASALPQGFLDDWKITPERLKAANGL